MSKYGCEERCTYYQEIHEVRVYPETDEVRELAGNFMETGKLCMEDPTKGPTGVPPRHCAVLCAARLYVEARRLGGEAPDTNFARFYDGFFAPGRPE